MVIRLNFLEVLIRHHNQNQNILSVCQEFLHYLLKWQNILKN